MFVPEYHMCVQKDLIINEFSLEDSGGYLIVIHMDQHDRLVEGLICVMCVDSLYEPMNRCVLMNSFHFYVRSSSDLHKNTNRGFVSHPELEYTALVKVADSQVQCAVCNMGSDNTSVTCLCRFTSAHR
jgi:hypothetical protein